MERNFLQLMWRGWCRSRELQPVCWGRNTVKTYRTSLNRWLKPREINTYPIKFKGAAIKYWFLVLSWRCNKRTNTSIRMLFVFFVLSLFFDQTRTEIGHIEVKSSPEGGGWGSSTGIWGHIRLLQCDCARVPPRLSVFAYVGRLHQEESHSSSELLPRC